MALSLRFLGCGDAFGSGARYQACLLLEGGSEPVLLDCGATSLVAMKAAGVDPASVGTVLISHLHGDHFGGLPFMVLDGQFSRRERPLVVAGPPGTRGRIEAAMEALFPGSSTVTRRFDVGYLELTPGSTSEAGPAKVAAFEAVHASGAPSLSLRVEYAGAVIGYSGDTEWSEALVEIAANADLFVCEAYHAERAIRYHLDYPSLLANRDRLTARRTVLTHMGPTMLALPEAVFERAYDGLRIDL
jgi:ribonuclease BN (tRNA processing enzyme)